MRQKKEKNEFPVELYIYNYLNCEPITLVIAKEDIAVNKADVKMFEDFVV